MFDKIAKIISFIFQPIFIPLYGIILLTYNDPILVNLNSLRKLYTYFIVFFTTGIIPAVVIGVAMKFGKVSDSFISNKKERPLPFILSFFGYLLCAVWLTKALVFPFYAAPILGAALALFIVILINYSYKISAHLTAAGGFCGGIFAYSLLSINQYPVFLIIAVLLSGLIAWSRIMLKAHTVGQVCLGWLNGFLCVALTWVVITLMIF